MPKFTLDGRELEAAPGQTILGAARDAGVDIPTLCFLEECGPETSCLVCIVKLNVNGQRRLVPSCATEVREGMNVESENQDVRDARRTALELLLSDHVGDCLSPCHRICPLHMNIPKMIRQIEAGEMKEAIVTVKSAVAFPSIIGRLCNHPCENGCRRGTWDNPAAIRDLERHVADVDRESENPYLPPIAPATGKSVAIVGAGPAGLTSAYHLLREGHACTIVDRGKEPGGTLLSHVSEAEVPRDVVNSEIRQIERMGGVFELGEGICDAESLKRLAARHGAVLLAIGECSKIEGEKLGVTMTSNGIKSDPVRYETNIAGVFAVGSAVKPIKQLVRAMREGQAVAACIDTFLLKGEVRRPDKEFSSVMGRLEDGEIDLFLKGVSTSPRTEASCGACCGFTDGEAANEASRCLHCDCRALETCSLRRYSEEYGAEQSHFRLHRRRFEQQAQPGGVIFEPGKCILCGICVKIAEQAREELGLSFIGRGFDVRVGVPFGNSFSAGLEKTAEECVRHCPSGALTNSNGISRKERK
ncbi:MAG: FAD-dependent oxidoreductase [Verrucomicrobia bacterium]|nr:FAD-dependent oxidoreductase [Verrucomicrobiota bacterium]